MRHAMHAYTSKDTVEFIGNSNRLYHLLVYAVEICMATSTAACMAMYLLLCAGHV